LRETLYNICDEDVQYVYAFWVPELPREEDRKAALDYFERLMALQAQKIARVLESGTPFQKRQLLIALTEFPIVRAWNPKDQIERNFYRIGNDLDAIDFRGAAADILEPVIVKLLNDPDPFVRARALVLTSYLRSADGRPPHRQRHRPTLRRSRCGSADAGFASPQVVPLRWQPCAIWH